MEPLCIFKIPLVYLQSKHHNTFCNSVRHEYKLTCASVIPFWVPHAKVSHGAGGEAHPNLTDVIALQEDKELGFAFNAAIVLRASVTAFGARWRPLCAN